MSKPDLTEHTLHSREVYHGRMLVVKEDQVRLPSGNVSTREYIDHPGAAVIVPLLANGDLVMLRQYRYPPRDVFVELPAGKLDPGEDGLASAQRELQEETGYVAERWTHLTTFYTTVGYSNEKNFIYLAEDLSFKGHEPDPNERLEIFTLPFTEALEWVRQGRICEGQEVAALLWTAQILAGRWSR